MARGGAAGGAADGEGGAGAAATGHEIDEMGKGIRSDRSDGSGPRTIDEGIRRQER